MLKSSLIGAFACAAVAFPAAAQEAYLVGVSAALTGPSAGTTAPPIEGLRLYIDRVNAAGGVNGKKIQLIIQDDQGEPSKAAANAKKLLTQDNVELLVLSSLSSTYAPVVAETRRADTPLLYMGAVCPKDVYPKADPLQFCSTAYAGGYDSRATLAFIKETTKGAIKIGFSAMAIPLSRGEIDYAEGEAQKAGMTTVDKEVIPPPTPDYTPYATKLKGADPTWVFSWAPWVTEVKTLEALRKLGWQGDYIAWAHIEAEADLARVKDPKFYVIGANALFQDGLPIQKEISEAAKKAGTSYPPEQMTEGWIGGLIVEAAMKGTAWPPTPQKVRSAMEALKIDTKGLRGGPIEWTAENHFRTQQHYRVYRWDTAANAVVRVKDWFSYDVR